MIIFNSIKFKFTLWYLSILAILLILLTGGVYFTLSKSLHDNLDEALQNRAQQLSQFRDIIAIVASGTFEEEIGELIAFYYDSNGQLKHISNKKFDFPIDPMFIHQVLSGQHSFFTSKSNVGTFRIYAQPYLPDNPIIDTQKFFAKPRDPWIGAEKRDNPRDREKERRTENIFSRAPKDRPIPGNHLNRPPEDPHDQRNRHNRPPEPDSAIEIHTAALFVARPIQEIDLALQRLLHIFFMAVPLTLFFAGGGGMFLARRAFQPVDLIARTAREIGESDLSRRIDVDTKDELGRLAATLNQMIARLERAFKRQKEFTGDASHELRTPLAVIQAEATLALQKDRDREAYQKSLAIISQEADHMSLIINQLLTLARSDSGKERLRFHEINLAEFLVDLCTDIKILCLEKNLDLQIGQFEKTVIRGDRQSLTNLLHNLLANAIRYTPARGLISVSLLREKNMAVISISDTGIGIPSEELPYIFDRFYRVDKARSRSEGGSGLGLAICQNIIKVHGGTIDVESKVQKGSTFHVRLPLA
jgi:heavy metal sensor kinase